jgi:diphosphomevalonate decarboxylase
MLTTRFYPCLFSNIEQGEFLWTAPSNIALVKYWGKGQSNSGNPSVSFTKTITKLAKKESTDTFPLICF